MKKWFTTWAQAHVDATVFSKEVEDITFQTSIKMNISGEKPRIIWSGRYNTEDVEIKQAIVIVRNRLYELTSHGNSCLIVSKGDQLICDEIDVIVEKGEEIEIRFYILKGKLSSGNDLIKTNKSIQGDYTKTLNFEVNNGDEVLNIKYQPLMLLSRVDVYSETIKAKSVVVFGDSNTFNSRWTIPLQKKLSSYNNEISIINMGISGNRLLRNTGYPGYGELFGEAGICRFDWDVMELENISLLIVALGGNDLYQPGTQNGPDNNELPTVGEMMDGYRKLIMKAKLKGIKVVGCTIYPFGEIEHMDEDRRKLWMKINEEILASDDLDCVIDLSSVLMDKCTGELKKEYESGDGLHLNDKGGEVLAEYIVKRLESQKIINVER
ncbi:GDSL-type esterase/lipase family protein [Breznakia pachnodae]|uniref:Lysophospholipase L1-like esterase n=1 Tax=Breznakia pachnodae TaxID=265178 RepID=A0ABU0E090_9FIRM|nr:GDSL-type esterase/lipase family protein [Breznakia pachnodae]MDQ0360299.1 lysophospholipase L1-like esterase [Breznakia pachnodae]